MKAKLLQNKKLQDLIFILWAGGAALLSYALVYALRKPFTAAEYSGLEVLGMDYKVVVTTIQILGYLVAKFFGIKIISEMKKENRFRFFVGSVLLALFSLVLYGLMPVPYNLTAMFFNGLSLGCMWGVIFSFIEGRRVTDLLASLLGVSMVISSGTVKSCGLYAMNELGIDQFWMPAVVGAAALPFLILMGYLLKRLPNPTKEDIALRSERVSLNKDQRKKLFRRYAPILVLILIGNLLLLVLRDIKEDFLVNIIDMENQSSWLFAQVDTIVTVLILGLFALVTFFKNNFTAIMILMGLVLFSCLSLGYIALNHEVLRLSPVTWLLVQSLGLYISYLAFQTIFFERFIACFKIKGNIGFFIAIIDFIGYAGTVTFLFCKEMFSADMEWFSFFNDLTLVLSTACFVVFGLATVLLVKEHRRSVAVKPVIIEHRNIISIEQLGEVSA